MNKRTPWLVALLCVVMPVTPYAQTTHPMDEVRENARSHMGPFYLTPAIVLRDLGVDSNVFNEAEDPKSDFTFTLSPKMDVAVPFARTLLVKSLLGMDFIYYQRYSSQRSASPVVAPRAVVFLNRLSFFGEGSYARSRQRPNYEIDARALRTERWYGGGVGYQFSPKLGIEASVRRADVKYDADEVYLETSLQETLNRDSDIVAGAVKYAVTPFTTIVLKADHSQDRFEFSPERDADTLRVMPGVEFNPRALIAGSAYVGVRRFDTKSAALEDFNGLVATAQLVYTLLGRTAFIVNLARDVTYSFEKYQPYFVDNSYGLTVQHRLAGKLDVMAGFSRHQYTYRDFMLVEDVLARNPYLDSPADEQRVDTTYSYSASLGYYLGPDVRLGFGTSYWTRDTNAEQYRTYDAWRTGISLTYGF